MMVSTLIRDHLILIFTHIHTTVVVSKIILDRLLLLIQNPSWKSSMRAIWKEIVPFAVRRIFFSIHSPSKVDPPSLYLRCHTNGCIWSKTIRTSEPIRDKNGRRLRCSELPAKMVYSFLLSGLTYQNYDEIMDEMISYQCRHHHCCLWCCCGGCCGGGH